MAQSTVAQPSFEWMQRLDQFIISKKAMKSVANGSADADIICCNSTQNGDVCFLKTNHKGAHMYLSERRQICEWVSKVEKARAEK